MILELFLISTLMVMIIDISPLIKDMEEFLERYLRVNKARVPKPFSCSLCMTFWSGLAYIILKGEPTLLNVTLTMLFAVLTPATGDLIYALRDLAIRIIRKLDKILDKNV